MLENINFGRKYSRDELFLVKSVLEINRAVESEKPVAVDLSVIRLLRSYRNRGNVYRAKNSKALAEDLVYSHDPEYLFEEIPNTLKKISRLQELDLSGNRIKNVPRWVSGLTRLKGLYLEDNKMVHWSSVLSDLETLEALNLSSNRLAIPHNAMENNIGLRELYLAGCYYSHFDLNLDYNTNLRRLDLSENRLSEFPMTVMHSPWITQLKLNFNHIGYIHPDIGYMYQLEYLDLSNNRLAALPTELMCLPNLKRVLLWNNSFSRSEIERIKSEMGAVACFKPR